ncbi:hypothetical protein C8R44DRAFT_324960 [Mycena epipterygia]|nr:hypothetical protein C8R44DRAFT_324960 [Mycena epipterygia]
MPTLAAAQASNNAFSPAYVPIAVFVGGTSGVGQGMAEAFARQTNGRAHIIIIGRNAPAAAEILGVFPKPGPTDEADGWAHEFVSCDATSMASIRSVCAGLRARLTRLNFLVITAAGPGANSIVACGETSEGLDNHLAVRYFARYLYTKELLPLLVSAQAKGQHAHMMSVLGAGYAFTIPNEDLGLAAARARTINILRGSMLSVAAMKGVVRGGAYNDGLVAHFAAQHPAIAFTHISPGQVLTIGATNVDLGWLLKPLAFFFNRLKSFISVTQDECAQYMLYALFDVERGLFIRDNYGEIVSAYVFNEPSQFDASAPTAHKLGVLRGVPMKGYGGSDAAVAGLAAYTERVLGAI